jgi:hypothetical protein
MAHCSCKKKIRHVPLKIIQLKSKTLKIKLKFIWAEFLTQKNLSSLQYFVIGFFLYLGWFFLISFFLPCAKACLLFTSMLGDGNIDKVPPSKISSSFLRLCPHIIFIFRPYPICVYNPFCIHFHG